MARIASSDRRDLLVQAALRVIAARGVQGATTRAIVAEAGMSLASFHYAFRSRDEMMRELVRHVVEAESTAAFAALRPGADIHELLRDALHAFLGYVIADPGHEQVMQELLQYALRTPGLGELAREQYGAYQSAARDLLVTGAAAAGVRWSIPVEEVARVVVAATDGVTLAYLVDRDAAAAARVLDLTATTVAALAMPSMAAAPSAAPAPAVETPALETSALETSALDAPGLDAPALGPHR
jgi:AcrR family transcriptional regulator